MQRPDYQPYYKTPAVFVHTTKFLCSVSKLRTTSTPTAPNVSKQEMTINFSIADIFHNISVYPIAFSV